MDRCAADCPRASLPGAGPRICPLEIVLVSIAVVALFGVCRHVGGRSLWFLGPLVLIVGSVLPTMVSGRDLGNLGLRLGRVRRQILLLFAGGAGMVVLGFISVLLLRRLSIEPPLAVSVPRRQWLLWTLFQLAYVAFPEELFFRGYVLGGSLRLLKTSTRMSSSAAEVVSVVISAGIFGLAHVLILGNPASALTFFPALIFGWFFVRMDSLIPSVLLHATANIGYILMARLAT